LKKSTLFFKRNLIIDFLTIIIKISFTHFFEHYHFIIKDGIRKRIINTLAE
jgi:hypothetical protein